MKRHRTQLAGGSISVALALLLLGARVAATDVEVAGARLKPALTELGPQELSPNRGDLRRIARHSGADRAQLEQVQLYEGRTAESVSMRVVTLPLGGDLEGVSIALAVDGEGQLVDGVLWGRPDVEEDENRTWRRVIEQFAWAEVGSRRLEDVDLTFDPSSYWKDLSKDTSEGAGLTRILYETRVLMLNNSDFYQRIDRGAARDEVPEKEWLESYLASFDRLGEIGAELTPYLGDSAAAEFGESAAGLLQLVATMAEDAAAGRDEEALAGFAQMQGSCFRCHNIRGHDLGWDGPIVFPGIELRLPDFGVRNDLFEVGMDVWAPPGEDAAAQEIANAVQAAMILVGSSS